MSGCRVLALPGGNPAPLVTLAWALHAEGVRVDAVHAVLYGRARTWLHRELHGGAEPLAQLRAVTGDATLAEVVEHPAQRPDGAVIEDDADPDDAQRFMECVWSVARALQQDPGPVVFALVSGRRRTLVADLVVVFQLLARPQDRLVELRLTPSEAIEATSGFYFPTQRSEAAVHRYDRPAPVAASEVDVRLVDVRVPRLRRLLPPERLGSYADALDAGDAAVADGSAPRIDLRARTWSIGGTVVRLSPDQMIWLAALAVAHRCRPDGWLAPDDVEVLAAVHHAALKAWFLEADELSDGWSFDPDQGIDALALRRSIRAHLRQHLRGALRGHPWQAAMVPRIARQGTGRAVATRERLDTAEIALCTPLLAVCAALGAPG